MDSYVIRNSTVDPPAEILVTGGRVTAHDGVPQVVVDELAALDRDPVEVRVGPEEPAFLTGMSDPAAAAATVAFIVIRHPSAADLPTTGWVAYTVDGAPIEEMAATSVVPDDDVEDLEMPPAR